MGVGMGERKLDRRRGSGPGWLVDESPPELLNPTLSLMLYVEALDKLISPEEPAETKCRYGQL